MAVRFANTNDAYSSTAVPGSVWTATCWLNLTADTNYYASVLGEFNGTGTYRYLSTDTDGTTLTFFGQNANVVGPNLVVGTWYRLGLVVTVGGTVTLYSSAAGSALATATGSAVSGAAISFQVGGSAFASEFLNGRIAALKVWSAALTVAEIENELGQYQPIRLANLFRYHPLINAELVDYAGAGRNFTAGAVAATTEAGPPIRWGPTWPRLILPTFAAVVTGTIAATGLMPTSTTTGNVTVTGVLAASLSSPTAALVADVLHPGALDGAAPLPTCAIAAEVTATATFSAVAPSTTAALTGGVDAPGQLAATPPVPAASIAATVTTNGLFAAELPSPISLLGGSGEAVGSLDATVPPPTAQMVAGVRDGGVLAGSLPSCTATFAADVAAEGTLSGALPSPIALLGGDGAAAGVLTGVLPLPFLALSTQAPVSGPLYAGVPVRVSQLLVGSVIREGAQDVGAPREATVLRAGEPTRVVDVHG